MRLYVISGNYYLRRYDTYSVSQGEDDVEQEPGAPPATRLSVKYQIVPSSAWVGQTVIPPVLYNLFL